MGFWNKHRLILVLLLSLGLSKVGFSASPHLPVPVLSDVRLHPHAFSLSADGSRLAAVQEGTVQVWRIPAQGPLMQGEPIGFSGAANAVALSPDGNLVAIGLADSTVVVHSLQKKRSVLELKGHAGPVAALRFSPDGQLLASGAEDGTTQVWDVRTGRRLHVFDGIGIDERVQEFRAIHPVAIGFTGDGRTLVVNDWLASHYQEDRMITFWDLMSGLEISRRYVTPPNRDSMPRAGHATGVGGWLLVFTNNDGLMIERLDRCDPPQALPFGASADTVSVDPLGRWVAAFDEQSLKFWDLHDQKMLTQPLPLVVVALTPHPDGRSVWVLATRPPAPDAANYDPNVGVALYRIPVPKALWQRSPLAISETATACPITEAKRQLQDFKRPESVPALRLLSQGKAVGNATNTLSASEPEGNGGLRERTTDPATGDTFTLKAQNLEHRNRQGKKLPDIRLPAPIQSFLADNGWLTVLLNNRDLFLWRLQALGKPRVYQKLIDSKDTLGMLSLIGVSQDGNFVQFEEMNEHIYLDDFTMNLSTRQVMRHPRTLTHFGVRSNRMVTEGERPHRLAVWDLNQGAIVALLPRQRSRGAGGEYMGLVAALSDSKPLVASGSHDGLLRVWNLDTRLLVGEVNTGGPLSALSFDPSATRITAQRKDGTSIVYAVPD